MVIDPTSPTRDINRRLLLTLHQDGLLDILAGLVVFTFGLIPILDETGMNPGVRQIIILSFYGVSVIVILLLKRKVTYPRAGYVKLARRTTTRLSLILLIVNVILFLIFAGVYVFDIPVWEYFGSYQLSVPLGLIFLVMFTVAGGLLKAPRFYLYGLVVMAAFIAGEHLYIKDIAPNHGIPVAGFVSGGLIMLGGLLLLVKFVKRYRAD